MVPASPAFHKPKSFIAAKNLLYASIFLGMFANIIRVFTSGIANKMGLPALLVAVAGYAVIILLIKQTGLCKKWARTVLTVWLILVIITYGINFVRGGITNIIEGALAVLQSALHIAALIFLYKNECTNWLNSTRDELAQNQV
jgi:K+ transporter